MTISATLVKTLRDRTGAGVIACKNALAETGGDLDAARTLLRERGMASAGKRAGRETTEGLVGFIVDGRVGSILGIGCETEPVSNNEEFQAFGTKVLRAVHADGPSAVDTFEDERIELIAKLGENIVLLGGARFEAPETISPQGRFEDVHRGGYDPNQHLEDMALDGVAGEVLYPSQGLFYFKVADTALMSAIFRAYNDWLAEFCRTDPARLKGIAMINLDDVQDGIRELERAARLGLSGAMITE